ncbi:hypothetical protein SAMD00020551_2237 [Mesobacillus selenatarsenatis SF-1]|uniref:Uncharacterized protein n=1 Tax=Mesobacillus selenatarsenatis (strain DSM 18680 / JCM 14380 / FERM P-15431 / SF-1) TaxID=1321606 RepID=A0A0A8X276_MESS1|nr:hypothetical protein SAMD00020551_2237 [Mesobacillus selenatarsenatis SF-1]
MVQFKREKAEVQPTIYLYAGRKLLTNRVSISTIDTWKSTILKGSQQFSGITVLRRK